MPGQYEIIEKDETPQRSRMRLLIVGAVAFVGGLIFMGWLLFNFGESLGMGERAAHETTSEESSEAVAALDARLHSVTPGTPGAPVAGNRQRPAEEERSLTQRVSELEAQIDRNSVRAAGSIGNADRAEGLLVAFAARRALDRGIALGYIEGLLQDRFGQSAPEAVARIISASQQPVTVDGLQQRLTDLEPALIGGGEEESWWQAFRRELSELVVVRQSGTPSPAPRQRLERARQKLSAGQVDAALAEVVRLPGREAAAQWIDDARRYVAARTALDRIETVALMEPRIAERQQRQSAPSSRSEPETPGAASGEDEER